MEIDRKYLFFATIVVVLLLIYIKSIKDNNDRFQNIIDTFIEDYKKEKKIDQPKGILKKVKFRDVESDKKIL